MGTGHLVGPVRADNQYWEGGEIPCERAEQVETGGIRPMEIIEKEQRGLPRW